MYTQTAKIPTGTECLNKADYGRAGDGTEGRVVQFKPPFNVYKNLPAPPHNARPAAPSLFGAGRLRPAARIRLYSRMSGIGLRYDGRGGFL